MSLILGLDPSTVKLGWALCDLETGSPVRCGAGSVKDARKVYDRLDDAFTDILNDPSEQDVSLIYMEKMYHGPNAATTVKLAEHAGVLLVVCWDIWPNAPVERITPGEWRKELSLPQHGKEAPMAMAAALGFTTGGDQDAADAACIATAGWVINDRGIRLAGAEGPEDS